jgi:hydroxypyruvate isomerase
MGVFRELQDEHPEYTVNWLAEKMCCDRRNIYNIFKRSDLDTNLLTRLSMVLHHNFYKDLYDMLEDELTAEKAAEQQQSQLHNFLINGNQGYAQHGLWYAEVIPGKFDESGEPQLTLRKFDQWELAKKCEEIDQMLLL